jgi:hypothetical protein
MATFYEIIPSFTQFEDDNGNPASGHKLNFYIAGTSTRKDTFRESDGVTANTNPIVLDSSGYMPYGAWGTTGAYKIVKTDANDANPRTRDNILGIGDSTTASGTYRVSGLTGAPNSGTPLTQYDLNANVVQLWQPSTKQILIVVPAGVITNNISTSGPTANGRDQSSAFSASSWIYLYYIYNGATLATVSSAAAPATGPTLPSGYTHWAFCGALWLNGSTQIVPIRIRGAKHYYVPVVSVLSAGSATVETALSLTSIIPPTANDVCINSTTWAVTTDGAGAVTANAFLRLVTTVNFARAVDVALTGLGATTSIRSNSGYPYWLPNVNQNIYYLWTVTTGSAPALSLDCMGFTISNGDS